LALQIRYPMIKKLILLFLVFLSFDAGAQQYQEEINALNKSLAKNLARDTNRVLLLNKISYAYLSVDPKKSLECAFDALKIATELGFFRGEEEANSFIGLGYAQLGEIPMGIDYMIRALKIAEREKLLRPQARTLNNLGSVYMEIKQFDLAMKTLEKAAEINIAINNLSWLSNNYTNIGNIHNEKNDLGKAKAFYYKALSISQKINYEYNVAINTGNLLGIFILTDSIDSAFVFAEKALALFEKMGDVFGVARIYSNYGSLYLHLARGNKFLDKYCKGGKKEAIEKGLNFMYKALEISKPNEDLNAMSLDYKSISELYELTGNCDSSYVAFKNYSLLKDSIFNIEKDMQITQTVMQYDFDKKEAATRIEQEKKMTRERNIRNSILAGLIGLLIFSWVVFRQRNKIKKEKQRSEELLLNILPAEVAEELKTKGKADARLMEEVTVLFTDFKGFTLLSEQLSPQALVAEINECFSAFDLIMQKHGIEKIKTIGDAYMAAGGLPAPKKTHAEDVVLAALEIQDFMMKHRQEKEARGKLFFEIRIGVHSGPVVAGIVGIKKFAYDIWGDTVNTASRMESSGGVGRVNISADTYALVKHRFNCTWRGKIEAKGKGEVDMYFVEGEKQG
jgi:adenylate cyclase